MSIKNTLSAQIATLALPALLSCAAFTTSAAQGVDAAPSQDTAPRWKRFEMIVYQYKTPPPGPEAKRVYESLNLHALHLDNGFSDDLLNFAKANNYPYYVDHSAGKGDLYIRPEEWQTFFNLYRDNRSRPQRPHSIWDPTVLARLKGNLRSNITRARTGPALAYAFDDEISVTSFTSPADVDWSPEGLSHFHAWLQTQYGTLDRLNAEWGTNFTDWNQAEPQTVDDTRHFHDQTFDQWNLSRWLDHRSFMNAAWADLLSDLTHEANALDPTTPAGFVGGQAPSTYGGYDYALLRDSVQWMEAYDIGGTNEILRSFWGQTKPHVQTYFLTDNPAMDKWFLWYYLVHGDRGVICWPESDKGPWFENGQARPGVQALAPTFKEVQGPISEIFPDATFEHDGIALYYSQPSIATSWFMDIQPHGKTWINRRSAMNNDNATDIFNRNAWTKLLEDSGFQYNFVSYRDVAQRGAAALAGYHVLILPRTLALSDAEAAAIREWVRQGGTLIADYLPGVFDEHGKARATGALDDVFGVGRDQKQGVLDGKSIAEINAELSDQPLAGRLSYNGARRDAAGMVLYERGLRAMGTSQAQEMVEGVAGDIKNHFGNGATYYMNWTPIPYLMARSGDAGATYRQRLAAQLATRQGGQMTALQPRVRVIVNNKEMPAAERLFWQKGGRHYLCVVMNPVRNAKVDNAGTVNDQITSDPLAIKLQFHDAVTGLKNERTGQRLGNGQSFSDQWVPCEANIYSW